MNKFRGRERERIARGEKWILYTIRSIGNAPFQEERKGSVVLVYRDTYTIDEAHISM